MEILKRGQIPEEKEFTVTCSYCSSVLKFKQAEANVTTDPRGETSIKVDCPVCNKPVFAQ